MGMASARVQTIRQDPDLLSELGSFVQSIMNRPGRLNVTKV